MKSINWHGTILTDEYYILPNRDSERFKLPLIKTPVVISDKSEIVDWTFATQRDAYIESCGCIKCGSDVLCSTLSFEKPTVTNWSCVICGHRWKAYRGIFIKPTPVQMTLFEIIQ